MGYTHFDKVSGINGMGVGAKDSEIKVIDGQGRLMVRTGTGTNYYVDSATGSSSNNGLTWDTALATIDQAVNKCTANNGDRIFVAEGHAETLANATSMLLDVAGISTYGCGSGNDKPKITIGTAASATIPISGQSIVFKNIIIIGALDGLDAAVTVTGDDCDIDIEYRDTSASVEGNIAIKATSVDRAKIKVNYIGFIAGDAVTNAVVLDGCTSCDVDVAFYGVASTSVVEFLNNACHNINVTGYFYNSGTTNLSKNVVDTATGSTWFVQGYDGCAGCSFSGGSGAALAGDDVSAVNAQVKSYMLVQHGVTQSYMKVEVDADMSYMLVQTTLDRSHMLVQAGLDQSYMLVQSDADRSYTLVQDTLSRSHMLVFKDSVESYMKVEVDAEMSYMIVMGDEDQSYMKVEADAAMSYILVQNTLDRSHILVSKDSEESYMKVLSDLDESYMKVQGDANRSYMVVMGDEDQSYMKVGADAAMSYMKVETDLCRSYILVQTDLMLSYMAVIDGQVT